MFVQEIAQVQVQLVCLPSSSDLGYAAIDDELDASDVARAPPKSCRCLDLNSAGLLNLPGLH